MYLFDTDHMSLMEHGGIEFERIKARLRSVPPDDVAGFETAATEYGVPIGWTTDAPAGVYIFLDNGSFAGNYGAPGPHNGQWDVVVGPYTDEWLSQTLLTQVGQQYNVSFWLYNKAGGSPNDFAAYWAAQFLRRASWPLRPPLSRL